MTASPPARWQRPFFALWTGQAVSLFGSALVQFALVWWLTDTTRSATVLAVATLMSILPGIVVAPFAGVVVDRFNRRLIMIVSDSLVALSTLVLAYLFWIGVAEPWHVYAAMFIRAAAGVFQFPAMQASTSLMVPADQLQRVQGFNQMLQGVMGIVAPPAGALLLGVLPLQGVLMIDVVTALMGVAPLFFIAVPQPPAQPAAAQISFLGEIQASFGYLVAWRGLFLVALMSVVLNFLLNPAGALLPILVTRHFGGAEGELALINSAFSSGLLVGGLVLGAWGGFKRRIYTSLLGLVLLGLSFGALGLVPGNAFWLAVGLAFIASLTVVLVNGPLLAILQAVVAPEMQGRVFSLIGSVATALSPAGLLIAGPVADAVGVQVWYLVGGVCSLGLGALAFVVPDIRNLEDHQAAAPAAAAGLAADLSA